MSTTMKYLVMLFLFVVCVGCNTNRTGWECKSCDREIAKSAEVCQHCGQKYSHGYKPQWDAPELYPRKVGELHPSDEGYDEWKEAKDRREGKDRSNTDDLPFSNTTGI